MTTINESFNKADSDTLGPDLTWVEDVGDVDIVSNRARTGTYGGAALMRAAHSLAGNDQYAEAVIYATSGTDVFGIGPIARKAASSTQTYYLLWFHYPGGTGTGALTLYKVVSGAFTTLGAGAIGITFTDGDTLRIECNGTTIRGLHNGTEILSRTDGGIASGAHTGVRYYNNSGVSQECDVDSFAAGDLGSSTLTATLIEATAGTDLASASALLSASLLDAAAGTDITSAQPTVARSLVDAAGGVDLVNSGVVVSGTLVEGVSAVDLSSALATLSVTVNEAVTVVELLAATRIANVAATEAAAGVDISTTGTSLAGSLVDAVVSADALSAAATLVASVLEAGGVVDQIHAAAQLVVLLTESAAGSDAVSRPAVYSVTATELVAALDVLSAAIGAAGLDPSARYTIAAKARRLTITAAARRLEIRK